MKRFVTLLVALAFVAVLAEATQAQWMRRYYRPMVVAPAPVWVAPAPVVIAPAPVVAWGGPPMVITQPTRVMYTRYRPFRGGTVVRSRPAYRRMVW